MAFGQWVQVSMRSWAAYQLRLRPTPGVGASTAVRMPRSASVRSAVLAAGLLICSRAAVSGALWRGWATSSGASARAALSARSPLSLSCQVSMTWRARSAS